MPVMAVSSVPLVGTTRAKPHTIDSTLKYRDMVAFYRVIFFHFPPFDLISRFPFNLSPLILTRARPFETVLITSPRSSFLLVALFLSLRPLCSALSDYCGHGNTKGKKHPSSVFALFFSAMPSRNCSVFHRLPDV